MLYSRNVLVVASVFFLLVSCRAKHNQETKAAVIDRLLDSLSIAKVFNGAVVIGENDSIIFQKGYGYADFKDSVLFTPTTLSDGGSLAKTFTAAALWKLQGRGILSLNDPVQKFLPEYPYPSTSILDLLMHNAGGLPGYDYFFPLIPDTAILTNERMLAILKDKKPQRLNEDRDRFNYENTGIDLAALIIERATGKKYQQVLGELFFQPVGMTATQVRPPLFSQWKSPRTIGYTYRNDSLKPHDLAEREGFYGSCNLLFTTVDLYKWGAWFYNSKVDNDLLPVLKKPGMISGKPTGLNQLNWYYSNDKNAYYYWGNVYGFYSHLYHDDEKKFTIAFMTNTTLPYCLRQPLTNSLIEIMETGTYNRSHFVLPRLVNIENSTSFPGIYKSGNGDSFHIFQRGKMLEFQHNSELRYNMVIVDSVTAYVPGLEAWISFTDQNNKPVMFWNSIFQSYKAIKQ